MPKYLIQFRYTDDGTKGLLKEGGTGRRDATEKLIKSVGGRLEAYYFAFGDFDGFLIADVPDNTSAAAISLAAGASGAVNSKTIVLMTPEQIDEVMKKKPTYRPPGQ